MGNRKGRYRYEVVPPLFNNHDKAMLSRFLRHLKKTQPDTYKDGKTFRFLGSAVTIRRVETMTKSTFINLLKEAIESYEAGWDVADMQEHTEGDEIILEMANSQGEFRVAAVLASGR